MPSLRRTTLVLALLAAGCTATSGSPALPAATRAWLERFTAALRFVPPGMQSHWLAIRHLPASDDEPTLEARFLTFQRRGSEAAYGVYGAHLAKSHMQVGAPLRGEPIAWPNRDHARGLAYLLEVTGMTGERAHDLVRRRADEWFRDGLRVFVAAPGVLWVFDLGT